MSRAQLLFASAWLFLALCCGIAGLATYLQVDKRLQSSHANQELRRLIAQEERDLQIDEQRQRAAANHLFARDTKGEDAAFLRQLQDLIALSGAHARQIQSIPVTLLPDIRNVRPGGAPEPNGGKAEEPATASLARLPLNMRARSTQVVLVGNLRQVRRFLALLARYSSRTMRINTNRMRIDRSGETSELSAVLIVTRFVRPQTGTSGTNSPPGP